MGNTRDTRLVAGAYDPNNVRLPTGNPSGPIIPPALSNWWRNREIAPAPVQPVPGRVTFPPSGAYTPPRTGNPVQLGPNPNVAPPTSQGPVGVGPASNVTGPLRATTTPQTGAGAGWNWYGSQNNMGYMRDASGRVMQIPGALPRRDLTGTVLRQGGRLAGSAAGGAFGGVGGIVGGIAGQEGGRRLGNWFNRMWRQRNSTPMPDTLTREQVGGAGGIGLGNGRDNALRDAFVHNQIGGYNLGRGMEGTYLDRTDQAPGMFRAHQRSNQMSRDMANPSVGPAIPDMPGHIYMGDENGEGMRHGMTHTELNSPEMRRARDASMVASTRDFMNQSEDANSSALSGPVTRESMIEALMRARGGLPPTSEASGAPMLGTAGPLTYDPASMGPFEPGQEPPPPPTPKTRAQLLLERYQRGGRA